MSFAAALSLAVPTARALEEVYTQLENRLTGEPNLTVAFFSSHHADNAKKIARGLHKHLKPKCLIGCMGEAIIGGNQEIENDAALSVWLAEWDDRVQCSAFHLTPDMTPDGPTLFGWPDSLNESNPAKSIIIALGDPFSFPANDLFLPRINEDYAGMPVHGGMASGMTGPGQTQLLFADEIRDQGAVGIHISGDLTVRSIVSQGCRPVGKPLVVTQAEENMLITLGGKPAIEQLRDMYNGLSELEQRLFQRGPHVGLVINEYQDEFHRGDFLVRNLIGMDSKAGVLAITDQVRAGQTVQFHVRDAATADEDLCELLRRNKGRSASPTGALLFTCNGRGTRLFRQPHHDAGVFNNVLGPIPLAGFFAAGEIGPIGGKNFLHGFTASAALFEE